MFFHLVIWLRLEASAMSGHEQSNEQNCQGASIDQDSAVVSIMQTVVSVDKASDAYVSASHQIQQQNQSAQPSFVVLLTTYNEPSRTEMYAKRIQWWLSETTLPIYVVDSYNAPFPEHLKSIRKFREYHFDQIPVLGDPPDGGSTPAEILSMKNAFEVFKDEWAQYDYVVKITGKYVLPSLTSEFAKLSRGSDFVVQSAGYNIWSWPGWVGTECLGFNAKRMGELLEEIEVQEPLPIESKVAMLLISQGHYSHQRLPRMRVPFAYQIARGDGLKLGDLLQESIQKSL